MIKELTEMAYKCKCIEEWVFNNELNKKCCLVEEYKDWTKIVYEKYNCRCNNDPEWIKTHIETSNRLIECHLGFEYFVSFILNTEWTDVSEELLDHKEAKKEWMQRFLSLVEDNDRLKQMKCARSLQEDELVLWTDEKE